MGARRSKSFNSGSLCPPEAGLFTYQKLEQSRRLWEAVGWAPASVPPVPVSLGLFAHVVLSVWKALLEDCNYRESSPQCSLK